ncbi:uncharacterized protein [Ptychodera flava]|uniref:uncharacterized protein n=1 Tax=Ptychodera flava TaxID=63121 RepID=UPI003969DA43
MRKHLKKCKQIHKQKTSGTVSGKSTLKGKSIGTEYSSKSKGTASSDGTPISSNVVKSAASAAIISNNDSDDQSSINKALIPSNNNSKYLAATSGPLIPSSDISKDQTCSNGALIQNNYESECLATSRNVLIQSVSSDGPICENERMMSKSESEEEESGRLFSSHDSNSPAGTTIPRGESEGTEGAGRTLDHGKELHGSPVPSPSEAVMSDSESEGTCAESVSEVQISSKDLGGTPTTSEKVKPDSEALDSGSVSSKPISSRVSDDLCSTTDSRTMMCKSQSEGMLSSSGDFDDPAKATRTSNKSGSLSKKRETASWHVINPARAPSHRFCLRSNRNVTNRPLATNVKSVERCLQQRWS